MVAAVRGQAYRAAKPHARASAKAPAKSAAAPKKPAPVSKFRASADGAGLSPKFALAGAAGVVVIALGVALLTGDRLQSLGAALGRGLAAELGAAGFRLESFQIDGASQIAGADIAKAAGLNRNTPLFGINLAELRTKIEAVGWVEQATVQRQWPNTILVTVKARNPVAVWQSNGVLHVIDAAGKAIPEADPRRFPTLPLLVGVGANEPGGSVLPLVRARPRLNERLEALVRVDQRRWDLRLKDGSIIQLPATGEEGALIQLDRLDQEQRLLELGFERIDLRAPDMIVVRRRDTPLPGQLLAGGV